MMDLTDSAQRSVFFEVHSGLPREAPGSFASTSRAVALARTGATVRRVLDVACGPGMQTLALARLLPYADILGVDLHAPYLTEIGRRAAAEHCATRVWPVCADMARLPCRPGVFDLVWCEGGAYLMGVERALQAWSDLLGPGGRIAFTDAVWLRDDAPGPVRDFWREYPAMRNVAGVRECIRQCGLELIGDFVLPECDWWDDYYRPMSERLELLRFRYAGNADAATVIAECQAEIDLYRQYPDCYGYAFFVVSA